jgi:hypothetical protein
MLSPFRDDEEAAGQSLEELWRKYEDLGGRVARVEEEVSRARAARWLWGLRVMVLGVTFGAAYFVGYYSSTHERFTTCGEGGETWQ